MTLAPPVDNPSLVADWFSPDSFMNTRVGSLRRVDPSSAAVVGKLAGWVHGKPASIGAATFTPGKPWINPTVNVYNADYTRRQKVTLTVTWWLQQAQAPYLESVPIPDAAVGNSTPDKSLVIVDQAAGTIWDFWKFNRNTTAAITAAAAGWITDHRTKDCVFTSMSSPPESAVLLGGKWGVQASGFSQVAGLTTIPELIQGCIPHATAFMVPWSRAIWYSAPAQRTDGTDTTASSIPYGARFMLDPIFDADAYQTKRRARGWDGLTPELTFTLGRFARMVINAWKTRGAVPVDQTGSGVGLIIESSTSAAIRTGGKWSFTGPNGLPGGPDAIYDQQPDQIMRQLPWEELKLMPLDLRRAL